MFALGVAVCECFSLTLRAPNSHRLRSEFACLDTLACPRAGPRVRFCTLTRILLVVWETPLHRLTPPRSAREEAVSSRAWLLWFLVALLGMVVNSAVPRVWPLLCVVGNASSLSLCSKVCTLHLSSGSALLGSRDRPLWTSKRSRAEVWCAGLPEECSSSTWHCAGGHWSLSSVLPALDSHVATLHEPAHPAAWSTSSFRFGLWAAAPPKQVRVVTTLGCDRHSSRSCPCCAWLCASWPAGTSRRRHAYTD